MGPRVHAMVPRPARIEGGARTRYRAGAQQGACGRDGRSDLQPGGVTMKQKSIGSLSGDLAIIAKRVCEATRDSMVTVWVSDHAEVYADHEDEGKELQPHWLVGTYSMGMNSSDIVEDLLEIRRERMRAGVLD
jgi:hypothetical protein